jgi:hypothetical protein
MGAPEVVTGYAGDPASAQGWGVIEVTASAEVELPADELFAFVADMSNNPRWQRGMERSAWITPPPIAVGSRHQQHARFLARDLVSTFEVIEFEPDRSIRIRTIDSPMPMDITRRVEPLSGGRARVHATIRGGPTGALALLDPLTKVIVQRSVRGDYARLSRLLAGGG